MMQSKKGFILKPIIILLIDFTNDIFEIQRKSIELNRNVFKLIKFSDIYLKIFWVPTEHKNIPKKSKKFIKYQSEYSDIFWSRTRLDQNISEYSDTLLSSKIAMGISGQNSDIYVSSICIIFRMHIFNNTAIEVKQLSISFIKTWNVGIVRNRNLRNFSNKKRKR